MPIGLMAGILLGLAVAYQKPHDVYMDVVFCLALGGCYDAAKRRGVGGFFSWLFLLFFGAVTGLLLGGAGKDLGLLPALRASQWGLCGCILGVAVWYATYWARLRSGHPIGRGPALLAAACLILSMVQSTLGIVGMFCAFLWWMLQALTGVLRANPERLAIEARQREAKRPF